MIKSVMKRNGQVAAYDDRKISLAIAKAILAVEETNAARVHEQADLLAAQVDQRLTDRLGAEGVAHIEEIQDLVELVLMRSGDHKVARAYVLYREDRSRERQTDALSQVPILKVLDAQGQLVNLDLPTLRQKVDDACEGLADTDPRYLIEEALKNLYHGATRAEVNAALILASRTGIEREPNYAQVTARLLLDDLRAEALTHLGNGPATHREMAERYRSMFPTFIRYGVEIGVLDPRLLDFDLERLGQVLDYRRDQQFDYLGLQSLYDRYFLHRDGVRYELPQMFFMRVAMGVSLNEADRNAAAEEFYELLSSFDYMASTPTLFNAGTTRPQLSSCFLSTVPDDLSGIYDAIHDNAMLSKFAGGLGNDWTSVRALGAHITGTNGKSQGVVPFLKVVNDTAVAVNQGGRRKGAVAAYLETWHLDIEEFLELRKNTGDERRRTHDMNSANWIPDLFMKRLWRDQTWTLFSPNEVPDLHDLTGHAFEERYEYYEALAQEGKLLRQHKVIQAKDLWRKMISMLFETGHPWICFKDPCNLRSPQQHAGVVHSSNLCTEITLNTSADEIAVCNLGSINLVNHLDATGELDEGKLSLTVRTAVRLLDNVIDINYYTVDKARRSNLRHRPVGLGIMGFQDALYRRRTPYGSEAAVEFADRSMELISYYAIEASCDLAAERGSYESFEGSLWSQGILPIDSIARLTEARGANYMLMDQSTTLDWGPLRDRVQRGMRNSNLMAIAPTATISNIIGVSQAIEPCYQNLYVKSNLSGEFTIINPYLVADLKALGLWDSVMITDMKFHDGSVQKIERVPEHLKTLYATAFEVDPKWLIESASRRQKWIDQSQSLNLYVAEASGKRLDFIYRMAWLKGLKTTYYLRAMGATSTEKSTLTTGQLNAVSATAVPEPAPLPQACSITDPGCEACQ